MDQRFWKRLGMVLLATSLSLVVLSGVIWLSSPARVALAQLEVQQLSVTNTPDVSEVQPGGEIEYTVVLHNNHSSASTAVVVTNTFDSATYVVDSLEVNPSWIQDGPVETPNGQQAVVPLGSVAANSTVTITLRALVADTAQPGTLVVKNTASVEEGGVVSDWPADNVRVIEPPKPLEGSQKLADVSEVYPGGVIKYSVVLSNSSESTVAPMVTDTLGSWLRCITTSVQVEPDDYVGKLDVSPKQIFVQFFQLGNEGGVQPRSVTTITFQAVVSESTPLGTRVHNVAAINDGTEGGKFERAASVKVVERPLFPTSRIDVPLHGAIITDPPSTTFQIRGVAWITPSTFPTDPILMPINYAAGDLYYKVQWTSVDGAETYVLQEAGDARFEQIENTYVVEAPEHEQLVDELITGTHYYRVRADKSKDYTSRWSNTEMVTVTQSGRRAVLPSDLAVQAPPCPTGAVQRVELSINGGAWEPVTVTAQGDYWDWVYDWVLPREDDAQYMLQTRAGYCEGYYGDVDTITVTIRNGLPKLSITKYGGPASVAVGEEIYYTLVVTNSGTGPANNLVITDALPMYTQHVTGGGLSADNVVSWTFDLLPPGETTSVTLVVRTIEALVTVVNEDYGAAAEGDSATGSVSVETTVGKSYLYMPLIVKRWPPYPYAPVIAPIENDDEDENYTVEWSYPYADPVKIAPNYYEFFESTDGVNWTSLAACAPGVATCGIQVDSGATYGYSFDIADKEPDTYYYIVRGRNSLTYYSPWSNIESIEVVPPGFRDDFGSNHASWRYRRGDDIDDDLRIYYKDGKMYTALVGKYDFGVASPMVEAPDRPYTIKTRFQLVQTETVGDREYDIRNGTTFGVVFGGNGGSPCPADRYADQGKGCFSHYYRVMLIWNTTSPESFNWQIKRIDYHDPDDDGKGKGTTLTNGNVDIGDGLSWLEIWIEVEESEIKLFIGGIGVGKASDMRYANDPYFGYFIGSPDIGDTAVKWDWFSIKRQ